MNTLTVPNRLYASLPADDPRFAELRAMLGTVKRTGKASPTARMLGEWALLGFLLAAGKIPLNGEPLARTVSDSSANPSEVRHATRPHEEATTQRGGFDA